MTANGTVHPPVLLVDDCGDTNEAVAALLEVEGFSVVTAASGAEALDRLTEGLRPCMIIVDVRMPSMNGWEFAAAVRREADLAATPVIMASGDVTAEDRAEASGVTAFLVKPLDPDRLAAIVKQHCAHAGAR